MEDSKVFDTVVFDLDGTLLNTLEDLSFSANYALERMGFPRRSRDEFRHFAGNGIGKMIKRAVPEGTSAEQTDQCLAIFQDYYEGHMADRTEPYPGIVSLLAGLKERGLRIGVASNKYDGAVKQLCRTYFDGLVDAAVGDNGMRRRKPAPDCVLETLRLLQSVPERTLYVGDSDVDMQTAKNAGVTSAGAVWGFRGEAELKAAGADFLAACPYHIWDLLL